MLIIIAGMVGAGKSTVARKVSDGLSVPFHSIDVDKAETGKRYPQFQHWVDNGIPFPDEFRIEVFETTLKRLRELAKEHLHVIIDETFHKKAIREPFFEEAANIFGGIILTFAETDDILIKERLERRTEEEDHMAGYEMYLSFKSKFEPFDRIDYLFSNNEHFEKNLAEYLRFLREKLVL